MSSTPAIFATVCVAVREPVFAERIIMYIEGKKGVKGIIECKNQASLLKFAETPGDKILLLDTGFYGMNSFSDIKNIIQHISAQTTVLFCDDSNEQLLNNLVSLNCQGYIFKNAECHIMRQGLNVLIKGVDFLQTAISNLTKKIAADTIIYNNIEFTSLEYKVLMQIKEGTKRADIPEKLDIQVYTYDEYRGRINKKIRAVGYIDIDDFLSKS